MQILVKSCMSCRVLYSCKHEGNYYICGDKQQPTLFMNMKKIIFLSVALLVLQACLSGKVSY